VKRLESGRSRSPGAGPLYVGMAAFLLGFLLCYPPVFAIVDEDAYLTQAYLFRAGRLTYEGSTIPAPHMTVSENGHLASKYPPGNSLFLVPFTLLGWRAVFLAGLLLSLAGTLVFRLVLRELDPRASPSWALLWLCYPAVALFSRTVMSDLLAATAVLASFYALMRRRSLLSGLALGFACLVRYSTVVAVPVWLALALAGPKPKLRASLGLLAGFAPFAAAALAYNWHVFGGPLGFPMYLTGVLSGAFFPANSRYYALNLLIAYPMMLLAPLAAGRHRWHLMLPGIALLLPYCFFSFIHEGGVAERLTLGMRYLLPALPFFILGFALVCDRIVRRFRGMVVLQYSALGLLLAGALFIQFRHQRYLRIQAGYRDELYRRLPADALLVANADASELTSYAWGPRRWLHFCEFNVPMPVDDSVARAGSVYAAMLSKPGDDRPAEWTAFQALLSRYPARELVSESRSPYRLSLYRLK
jgi:hypothetical protein